MYRKDPTAFRARFKAYKEGKMPYENGLPKYEDGKAGIIQKRLYRNILPMDYDRPVERVFNAVALNKPESKEDHGQEPSSYKTANSLWAEYLGIPKGERLYKNDIDGVTTYNENGNTYTELNNPHVIFGDIINSTQGIIRKHATDDEWYWEDSPQVPYNKKVDNKSNFVLGDFQTWRRIDPKRGEYIDYRDKYDINPYQPTDNIYGQSTYDDMKWYDKIASKVVNKYVKKHPDKDASFGIGNPLNIKGKIYLEDIYGAPKGSSAPDKGDYFGGWLPELSIIKYRNKKKIQRINSETN